ncbi:metallophosphoesterase family protein [Streptacidiphilus melanogenes]|uniref:metallophosphoesterase family protein n=1 Tax=Streptacidiphilus melanogenes TaxID=411235 RepID=UPI001269D5A2|nr:metallophosphoesterase family protein [Streptacidiphilus melanogenes]
MTPVDRPAWPDQPDPGPHAPQAADGSTPFDFFTPSAPPAPAAPGAPAPPMPLAAPQQPVPQAQPVQPIPPMQPMPQAGGPIGFGAPTVPANPAVAPPMPAVPTQDPPTLELGAPIVEQPSVPAPAPAPALDSLPGGPDSPLYVIGDVHGYLQDLLDGLHEQGLIDAEGHWSAGRSRLWFLGDFTDRGPDGIGVIDLVMRLAAEAAADGGYCRALMGNHELLLLGADRYGEEPVHSSAGTASFLAAWRLNGGQPHDMERLEDHHVAWLSRLPAMTVEDDHLLVHSDTTAYLEYGDSVAAVNDAIREVLNQGDPDEWWDCFRRMTKRFAFRGEAGPEAARELLAAFGGHRIVHGHSPIPYLLGEAPTEDGHAGVHVTGPHVYADDLAVAMDGGVTMEGEGKLLIARLPLA